MCGIVGGWWAQKDFFSDKRFEDALNTMRRRGPDDQGRDVYDFELGCIAFGHTRLSIIDLSYAGHQPMSSEDGRYSLVFNGEIYNYKELKKELSSLGHQFKSDSDTEVLLTAWMQWNKECLTRLTGMFAFSIFDKHSGLITCVRDAFGIKPFFYTLEANNFLFASELSAIKALKSNKAELNWQRAYDYLVYGHYDTNNQTFYRNVFHLSPGHLIELDINTGELSAPCRWWKPSIIERVNLSFSDATELVRDHFLQNIRLHLRSDVAIGAALSGGIDSSAVVCAMRHVEPELPINTFSYIARGSKISEENWVDRINEYTKAKSHKVIVGSKELAQDLDDMILAQGEPFGSTSIYAQYRVFKLAREFGVTVTLDGQGADEMLAGYSGYPGPRLRSLLETGRVSEAFSFLNKWAEWPGRGRVMGVKYLAAELTSGGLLDFLRKLNGFNALPKWIEASPLIDANVKTGYLLKKPNCDLNGRRLMAELAHSLTERGLMSLLRHGDRNSMRFSVESRVPFLTTSFVNLLLSLPESYLISPQGETKHVFRAAMRGIVPDDVLDRRDKIGFETPEKEWLTDLSETVRSWLLEDLGIPFLNQKIIIQEFDAIIAGKKPFSLQVWRWINFCRWYKACM